MVDSRSFFSAFRPVRNSRVHRDALREGRTLRLEREQVGRAVQEYRRAFHRTQIQARRDGRQLLKILDNLPRSI